MTSSATTTALPPRSPSMESAFPKRVHLLGAGGAGVSGLGRILAARGVRVSGHDRSRSALLEGLRAAAAEVERPPELGPLEISVTPMTPVDREMFRVYEDLGVDRVIVYPLPLRDVAEVERFLRDHAALIR